MRWLEQLLGKKTLRQAPQYSFPDPRLIEFIKADSELARIAPDGWPHDQTIQDNAAFWGHDGDILTEDFCQFGGFNFIRCNLPLPFASFDHTYKLGIWATLSDDKFQLYLETFDEGSQCQLESCVSWLGNKVLPDALLPVEGSLMFFNERVRPHFYIYEDDHPIAVMQDNGITFEHLAEFHQYAGRDIQTNLKGN